MSSKNDNNKNKDIEFDKVNKNEQKRRYNSFDSLIKTETDSESESNLDDILNDKSSQERSSVQQTSEKGSEKPIEEQMKIDYIYPDPADKELQYKLYKKRELYLNKIQKRPDVNDYNDIKEYRDNICDREFSLYDHQALLSNFINPDTPYRGVLVFHGVGSGKCILGDSLVTINRIKTKISNIWSNYRTDVIVDDENGEWSIPRTNLFVDSLSENRIIKIKIDHLYREHVQTKIRKIVLSSGQQIRTTLIHKLLTHQGWTNVIRVGDYVAISNKNTNTNKIGFVNVTEVIEEDYSGYVYDLEIQNTHNYIANDIFCHNTCAAVAIGEKFKQLVQKYNTKIYILVSGPLLKENWKNHLLKCTGETYLKYQDKSVYIDEAEKIKQKKAALNQALQYYRFMSYRSFYKRVLGEKIVEKKVIKGSKVRVSYRKTDEGEFERDLAVDRIFNLNNSLIIIDEAHNLTGNAYGDALMQIIKNSTNLRVVLLSATPMKNLADDIVELLNFIRPPDSLIERDKIFNSNKNHLMDFKEGGIDYLKNMARGYVSHLRGADPLTYAKRVEMGVKPDELLFTKIVQCKMYPFQQKIYDEVMLNKDDTLDRRAEAVANFVFPGLTTDRKDLAGYYGREGVSIVKNQLKTHYNQLNKKIAVEILGEKDENDLMYLTENGKTVTGKLLKMVNLKYFSSKFYKALKKLNRLVWGKKGARTAFVYSNLVKVGIELFQEILLQNGYLEYQDNYGNYQIKSDTMCYFCGLEYKDHVIRKQEGGLSNDDKIEKDEKEDIKNLGKYKITEKDGSSSSTEYKKEIKGKQPEAPKHEFFPATFVTITGKTSEESAEMIPEDKQKILDDVFSSIENKEGKHIKLILGSKVMNEGLSLKNVSEVHILDVYFNLGKVDQVVGRAIRYCSHYRLMNENNIFPVVKIYKYSVTVEKGLSSEEELYQKAELKYLLIKKAERALKEVAIDCPLNMYGNMFKEEIEQWKNCGEEGADPCPVICDYTKCNYKCDDLKLNTEYYDPHRNIYKNIPKDELDYTTFTQGLAKNEIDYAKKKIKELFGKAYVYTLDKIIEYVRNSYSDEKRDLFDNFFVYNALNELIPLTENDFNNFKDTILDKYNRQGYLIYNNSNYIFQPFDQNEDVPMHYRTTYDKPISHQLSLYNYLKNTLEYQKYKGSKSKKKADNGIFKEEAQVYDFNSVMEYYDNRDEFKFVGIIDKELSRRKNKQVEELKDVFKIREKRAKVLDKKRGTGIPSLKGAVCSTSKNKEYLEHIAKQINLDYKKSETRISLCDNLRDQMLLLEKYSTEKDKNKITYVMVPANHPMYPFPYNLEDRVKHITDKIKNELTIKTSISVSQQTKKAGPEQGRPSYKIKIQDNGKMADYENFLQGLGAVKDKKDWVIDLE